MKKRLLAVMAAVMMLGSVIPVSAEEAPRSVTVKGTGKVVVTPDLASIAFAVTENGADSGEVQKTITEKANGVKTALFDAGLAEEQFKTGGMSLYTEYDYSEGYEKPAGYRGSVSMTISEITVDEIGKYLQVCSANGVNQIDGVSVYYSGYEEAYNEALTKAMKQARTKAEIMAEAEGAVLNGNFSAEEGYQDTSLMSRSKTIMGTYAMEEAMDSAMYDAGGLDYTAGTTEVEANVTVSYEIG